MLYYYRGVKMLFPKNKRYEDPEYLAFIRTKCCLVCGSGETVPHHYISVGAGGSDLLTIPLCADHHTLQDDCIHILGKTTFPEHHGINVWEEIARLLVGWTEENK